jgi:hypothetical protein
MRGKIVVLILVGVGLAASGVLAGPSEDILAARSLKISFKGARAMTDEPMTGDEIAVQQRMHEIDVEEARRDGMQKGVVYGIAGTLCVTFLYNFHLRFAEIVSGIASDINDGRFLSPAAFGALACGALFLRSWPQWISVALLAAAIAYPFSGL